MVDDSYARVDEIITQSAGKIIEIKYIYTESMPDGSKKEYNVDVIRENYEKQAKTSKTAMLPFESFMKVLRPFMMGKFASDDIPEAFRTLDADRSGTIDIGELSTILPAIIPDINPHVLLHQVQKVDKNFDYKLNLQEFTDLLTRGIGRDIVVGHL